MPVLDADQQTTYSSAPSINVFEVSVQPPGFSREANRLSDLVHWVNTYYRRTLTIGEVVNPFDEGLEADADIPLTVESLAARHREFLADNKREWLDIDLPMLP